MANESPVIIIGMHRSGTTLLTDTLIKMGLFAGKSYGKNIEDLFFQRRNEWVLRRCGGAWDYPNPSRILHDSQELRHNLIQLFRNDIFSRSFRHHKEIIENGAAWGWKDPRTIFTLPLWTNIFPEAKLLYIKRNGVDVASSLHVRASRDDGIHALKKIKIKNRVQNLFLNYERFMYESVRCTNLDQAYLLWEEYMTVAEEVYNSFSGPRFTLKYEDLLESPEHNLRNVAHFCGLSDNNHDQFLSKLSKSFNKDRKYAFLSNSQLLKLYNNVRERPLMIDLGYGQLT